MAGSTLDWFVGLPFDAVAGEVDAEVIFRLGIAAGPMMGLSAMVAVFFYARYNLSRERHAEILRQLQARQQSDEAVNADDETAKPLTQQKAFNSFNKGQKLFAP